MNTNAPPFKFSMFFMFEGWRGVGFLGMGGEGVKGLYFGVVWRYRFHGEVIVKVLVNHMRKIRVLLIEEKKLLYRFWNHVSLDEMTRTI